MKKILLIAAGLAVLAGSSWSAALVQGSLVVTRFGDGSAALSNASTAVFLDDFSLAGSILNTNALPTAASGANHALNASGTATSEGQIQLSGDGQYLTVTGYDVTLGTTGANSSVASGGANQRAIGRVAMDGTIDSTTGLGTNYSAGNPRSAYTTNGTDYWTTGSNTGMVYSTLGGGTTNVVFSTTTNLRVVSSFGGDLYYSTGSGTGTHGVYKISGQPTSGPVTATALFQNALSPYDFFFKDANTLYVADDSSVASGGGVQKYTQSGGIWTLAYTSGGGSVRSLAYDGTNIYAVTTTNTLVSLTDTGSAFSAYNVLATAGTNTAFRGVEFIPQAVPEPASLAVLGLGVVALIRRRRSK